MLKIPQAYKHVFTSPSSVEKEPRATRSGNARIHGMTKVTPASIAYVATQVCRRFRILFVIDHTDVCSGSLCVIFLASLL